MYCGLAWWPWQLSWPAPLRSLYCSIRGVCFAQLSVLVLLLTLAPPRAQCQHCGLFSELPVFAFLAFGRLGASIASSRRVKKKLELLRMHRGSALPRSLRSSPLRSILDGLRRARVRGTRGSFFADDELTMRASIVAGALRATKHQQPSQSSTVAKSHSISNFEESCSSPGNDRLNSGGGGGLLRRLLRKTLGRNRGGSVGPSFEIPFFRRRSSGGGGRASSRASSSEVSMLQDFPHARPILTFPPHSHPPRTLHRLSGDGRDRRGLGGGGSRPWRASPRGRTCAT